jgi:hypothetical protein
LPFPVYIWILAFSSLSHISLKIPSQMGHLIFYGA